MGLGIEVFDEHGNTIIDTSRHTTSILGHVQVGAAGTYTVSNARFGLGTPFFLLMIFIMGWMLKVKLLATHTLLRSKLCNLARFSHLKSYTGYTDAERTRVF